MCGAGVVLVWTEAVERAEGDVEQDEGESNPFDDNLLFMAGE